MKKLKPNASLLLVCLSLNSITSMFVYTFLLAHIIDLSSNSIINIAIFYLVLHVSMIVLSLVLAPLFKKMNKDSKISLCMAEGDELYALNNGDSMSNELAFSELSRIKSI